MVLLPMIGLAQYEYIIPKTEISSRSGYEFSKNHLVLVFVAANTGIGKLYNGCGYDTIINYKNGELVTIGIPHPQGRLFIKDKEKVTNCNFILETSTPVQLNCYLTAPESTGSYSVLEKSETGSKYHVAFPPYHIYSPSNNILNCRNRLGTDSASMGVNTTICAFENNTKINVYSPYCSGHGSLNTGKLSIVLNKGESFTFQLGSVKQVFPRMAGTAAFVGLSGGVYIESVDSCKPIAVYNFEKDRSRLITFPQSTPPFCDPYNDCVDGFFGNFAPFCNLVFQQLPDRRLRNEYLLVPNRMNLIKDPNITYRWYYRTNHYYIQTSVDNEIWLNDKKFVVKADSFLCDSFVTPIHVRSAKPVHVLNVHLVPRDPNRPRSTSNTLEYHLWRNSNIYDVTYASGLTGTPELQLATPPNLITVSSGNCVLAYAWNSDTVNVNGKTIHLRFRHGNNYYDTFGTRQSTTLYTIRNLGGVSAVYMALALEHINRPTGGVHSLDPVPPVWQNRIAINRPAANWEGFDDTGRAFVCRNNPARFSAETGLDSPYKVYWYLQNVLVDSGAVVHYTFKDTGAYRLRGRFLFKSPGCYAGLREENLYRNISVYSDLHDKLPDDTLLCVGNSLQIQRPFNPRDRYRYFYSGGRLACDTCSAQLLRPNRNNLMLRMQVTRTGCKGPFRDTLRLFLRDSLRLQTILPDTLCHGLWKGPLLRAKGGDSSAYCFVLAVEGQTVNLPLAVDTAFTLRLSVGDGCSAPADTVFKRLSVRPALNLQVRADTTLCQGTALQPGFTASGGLLPYAVTWFRGENLHSDTQKQFSDTTLMAVLEDGCSRPDTAYMRLRVAPRLTAAWLAAPPARLCTDGILRFSAIAAGGMGTAQWRWLRQAQALRSDTGMRFVQAATAAPGAYSLVLHDACPDSAVLDFVLSGPDKFKVRWNVPDTLCPNSSWELGLEAQNSDSLLRFESHLIPAVNPFFARFRSGDTLIGMQAMAPGSYRFLFSAGDGCMLPDSQLHNLIVSAPPVLPADTLIQRCASERFDYPFQAVNGWMNRFSLSENALPAVPANAISDQQSQGTRYTVEVIDRCGNRDQQNVELRRLQAFSGPLLADTTLCPDEPLLLLSPVASAANMQPASADLQWQLGMQRANFSWNTGTAVPRPNFSTPAPGLYRLYFRATVGSAVCDSLSSSLLVYPAPVAAFTANRTRTFIEDPEFLFSNQSSGADRFRWQINGSDSGLARNLRFVAGDTGLYRILLNAFSPDGCWDSAAMQVRVVQLFRIFLPNAFTPGNDQLNESYEPKGTAIGTYTLRVYNRWGQQVFEADPQHPFTGRDRLGRPLPEGVYAVTAIVQSVHGERAFLQTTVHVLR